MKVNAAFLLCSHYGNYGNLLPQFCPKNSVKSIFLLKNSTLNWFDGKNFAWHGSKIIVFLRCEPDRAQCGNYGNFLTLFFGKSFVKVTVLLIKLLNSWFDDIFFRETESKIFRQIKFLVVSFAKPVKLLLSRNFTEFP